MKNLSLKLDDVTFEEAEKITAQLNIARNRYINEAIHLYNLYQKKRLLKAQLAKESGLTAEHSLSILAEFEQLDDENRPI